jgi:hypothetical protein
MSAATAQGIKRPSMSLIQSVLCLNFAHATLKRAVEKCSEGRVIQRAQNKVMMCRLFEPLNLRKHGRNTIYINTESYWYYWVLQEILHNTK